ncbi:hypothetical protein [Arthrobacter sp. CAN_A1]|uniref:hypothetical protein n=1 Tax=Arthrobacter sp. CAN_A1 TaxID=2787717 RepID=UPI002FCEF0DF
MRIGIGTRAPPIQEFFGFGPIGVSPGGERFADAGLTVADANGVLSAHGVGELGEPTVFLGNDETL